MKFSHDQAFKNLISEYMLGALQFFFPELTADWPDGVSVTPVRQEQLKQRMGDSFRELDIPLQVEFRDGSREALIIVIETESRDRAEFLKYLAIVSVHMSMQMKTDRVVPAVIYPFRRKPFVERFTLNDGARNYLEFSCMSCVLSKMDARKYERSRNIVARLCLPLMAHDPADKLRLIARAYEGLIELEPDFGKRLKYSEFINHYAALDANEIVELRHTYVETSPFQEEFMTLHDVLMDEGKAIGKAEGLITAVTELFDDGLLTAEQTKARLKSFADGGKVPKELVTKALRKIRK